VLPGPLYRALVHVFAQGAHAHRATVLAVKSLVALTNLVGTRLSKTSCDFSRSEDADHVFACITELKTSLELAFDRLARNQPVPPIGKLVRALR